MAFCYSDFKAANNISIEWVVYINTNKLPFHLPEKYLPFKRLFCKGVVMKLTLEKLLHIREEVAKVYLRKVLKKLVSNWLVNEMKWSRN